MSDLDKFIKEIEDSFKGKQVNRWDIIKICCSQMYDKQQAKITELEHKVGELEKLSTMLSESCDKKTKRINDLKKEVTKLNSGNKKLNAEGDALLILATKDQKALKNAKSFNKLLESKLKIAVDSLRYVNTAMPVNSGSYIDDCIVKVVREALKELR